MAPSLARQLYKWNRAFYSFVNYLLFAVKSNFNEKLIECNLFEEIIDKELAFCAKENSKSIIVCQAQTARMILWLSTFC